MIIDAHVHLVDDGWVADSFLTGNARVAVASASKATGQGADPGVLVQALKPVLCDPTGEKLVAAMDSAGVDLSCVFAVDYGLLTGEPGVSIADQNRAVAQAVRRFPDRLVGFLAVDPRREGAPDLLRRGVEDWGLRGLKLHPTVGYSIVMAHAGHNWYEEALLVLSVKPNVSVDISGWQRTFMESPALFYRVLRQLLDAVGPWRVFFGSDGPYLNVLFPLDRWVRAVSEPEHGACPEVSFTREELDIVMGRAFAGLLGLPGEAGTAVGR